MQLIPEYTNPLGTCTACRSARRQDEVIIDLGGQVELLTTDHVPGVEFAILDGDWQICSTCVTEMGRLLGMETPDKVSQLGDLSRRLQDALDHAEARAAAAETALRGLLEYRAQVQAVGDSVFGEEK